MTSTLDEVESFSVVTDAFLPSETNQGFDAVQGHPRSEAFYVNVPANVCRRFQMILYMYFFFSEALSANVFPCHGSTLWCASLHSSFFFLKQEALWDDCNREQLLVKYLIRWCADSWREDVDCNFRGGW